MSKGSYLVLAIDCCVCWYVVQVTQKGSGASMISLHTIERLQSTHRSTPRCSLPYRPRPSLANHPMSNMWSSVPPPQSKIHPMVRWFLPFGKACFITSILLMNLSTLILQLWRKWHSIACTSLCCGKAASSPWTWSPVTSKLFALVCDDCPKVYSQNCFVKQLSVQIGYIYGHQTSYSLEWAHWQVLSKQGLQIVG